MFFLRSPITIGLALLAVLGGVFFWRRNLALFQPAPVLPPPVATSTPRKPTVTPSTGIAGAPRITLGTPQNGTAPPFTGEAVATLAADPATLSRVPASTYEHSQRELAELAVALAKTPRDTDAWMRVAYIKHFYGDHAGSRDVYEYLNIIADELPIPFLNLGTLYGYYLKEPAKAIPKFQAALQRDPINVGFYLTFADFYREVTKDYAAAERVLLQGRERVPKDVNFSIALGALYNEMGKTEQAIASYEEALGDSSLSASQRATIGAEVDRLKSRR